MGILLTDLLKGILPLPDGLPAGLPRGFDQSIEGLALDSRLVRPGDLFFACAGSHTHGLQFVEEALHRGAVAVLLEGSTEQSLRGTVPILGLPTLADTLGIIAARFYGHPARAMTLLGVTGTNGKTSITHLLAQILDRCTVVGTLGVGFLEQLTPATHTTPNAIALQKILADFVRQEVRAVAMEVSSHALDQGRAVGVAFTVALFTNLTRDHLDYHGNMESYGRAKARLFHSPGLRYAVINTDDEFGQALLRELPESVVGIGYGFSPDGSERQVVGHDLSLSAEGIRMQVCTPWGSGTLESSLLGRFNALNLLAVLATLGGLGWTLEAALAALSRVHAISGRMETLGGGSTYPLVVVDYAHTPDALEQVLITLRPLTKGRLWCVFGCGGERDRGKRPLMGSVVERLADVVVITNDNPRTEEPADVVNAIVGGLCHPERAQVILDRAEAIRYAIGSTTSGDVVLLAGKGHEQYQQVRTEYLPFSDRLEAEKVLGLIG